MTRQAQQTTLLELVQTLQDEGRSDPEVVAMIADLVNSGRVVLRGIFAGRRVVVL